MVHRDFHHRMAIDVCIYRCWTDFRCDTCTCWVSWYPTISRSIPDCFSIRIAIHWGCKSPVILGPPKRLLAIIILSTFDNGLAAAIPRATSRMNGVQMQVELKDMRNMPHPQVMASPNAGQLDLRGLTTANRIVKPD